MVEKLKAMVKSRRFWTAVGSVVVICEGKNTEIARTKMHIENVQWHMLFSECD